jgi:S1-C subfamily serine protease
MRVVTVSADSLAYEAGIDSGDIIRKANGALVANAEDLAREINAAAPSGTLKLTIERGGREYNTTIPLDKSAPR